MKLFGSLTSPYVRKVRIVLAEKRINCTFEVAAPWDADSEVANHNPLGKVPVLILEDGTPLYDSHVIVEYLDSASPVSRLIPSSGRDRAMVKRWEALSDGISDAAATIFLERKRPTLQQSPEWILRQQQKITRGLEAAAQELGTNKWCNGSFYTLADIALVCALGYLALRFPEVAWRTSFPNLADLSRSLEKRASFVATLPKG